MPSSEDISDVLANLPAGVPEAVGKLLPLVYEELHAVAEAYMRRERPDHTLQPTALINEVYLRLVDQSSVHWENRAHFFAVAAQAMRRILVNHAKHHGRAKRGGGRKNVPLPETLVFAEEKGFEILELDEALTQLSAISPDRARVVELRFFGGLTIEETAQVLGVSTASVERYWRGAKAWLYRQLTRGGSGSERDRESDSGPPATSV